MTKSYNPDLNLFMMCEKPNASAMTDLPEGYRLRHPRRDELGLWKRMPFDGNETAGLLVYMDEFFDRVYAPEGDLFFRTCLFAVNQADQPVGTCFSWKTCGRFTTLHWFKVLPPYEGRGIGRALLSAVLRGLAPEDYPVYLHTQVGSFRAVKLYSDFGFRLLQDDPVGRRRNELEVCLPLLKRLLPARDYENLVFARAGRDFLQTLAAHGANDF